jgi:flagellin-like hook-associated protein FlgL
MEKIASPFDDIGFLAGGPAADADPVPPPKSQGKKELATSKQRPISSPRPTNSAPAKNPPLGAFLEKAGAESLRMTNDNKSTLSRRSSGRLEKTLSTRDMFTDEEASLALLVALGKKDPNEDSQVNGEKSKPGRSGFDFSKASLGLSALGGSKAKGNEDSKGNSGASRSAFFTSKSALSANKSKPIDASKSSFSGVFGSSRSSANEAPVKQSKGSKFSIMMRKEKNCKKPEMTEERVVSLGAENVELSKENNLLRAKLEELDGIVGNQRVMREWTSIEELANVTTEMWQHQSLALLADAHIDKLEAKLGAFQRLIDAKERSINNLEKIRNKQEQRIVYLEVQCLQNGVVISDGEHGAVREEITRPALLKSNNGVPDDASFHEDDLPTNIGPLCRSNRSRSSSRGSKASAITEREGRGRHESSESNLSTGMSDLSNASEREEDPVPAKPDSWGDLLLHVHKTPKLLDSFLVATATKGKPCLETGTWDPTKNLEFFENSNSPRGVGTHSPPAPPEYDINTPPAPLSGKVLSQSTRSKSPGRRRRLKSTKSESFEGSGRDTARPLATGSKRMIKKEPSPSANGLHPTVKRCASSNSITMRRTGKSGKSNAKWADPLGSNSTHSLGNRRRLRKQEADVDRQTVSSALDKALGSSEIELNDMDKNLLNFPTQMTRPRRSLSDGGASRLRNSPRKAQEADEDDDGFGLLDAVFQD